MLAVAVAGAVAAAIARSVAGRAGVTAEVFAVGDDVMSLGDLAFAVSAGTLGSSSVFHSANT